MLKIFDISRLSDFDNQWYVYFLESTVSNRSYVGMSNGVLRRLEQHNGIIPGGARYTTQGRPWQIKMVLGPYDTRSIACRVEWRAKRFRGVERFKYRRWVAELEDAADDKDVNLQHKRKRKRK